MSTENLQTSQAKGRTRLQKTLTISVVLIGILLYLGLFGLFLAMELVWPEPYL